MTTLDELLRAHSRLTTLHVERWVQRGRTAGLDDESLSALFADTLRPASKVRAA